MTRPLLSITPEAQRRIATLLDQRGKPSLGIRIGVRTRGCSGYSYTIEYADDIKDFEEIIELSSGKICVDPKALLFLIGTEMDYVDDPLQSGFVFKNPNEKGRCGCGESFHV